MKKKLFVRFLMAGILLVFMQVPVSGQTFYNLKGQSVEKNDYENIVRLRSESKNDAIKAGSSETPDPVENPGHLRNRRIEQWRHMRKFYSRQRRP